MSGSEEIPAAGPEREHALENVGWGLAVFACDRPGLRRSALSGLAPTDRGPVARGVGMGLRASGRPLDLWEQDPLGPLLREGATRLEAESAAGETPGLPTAGSVACP